MRRITKLLVPAFIAVAMLSACEDKMDEMTIGNGTIETFGETEVMPPKSKIKLPPGYQTTTGSTSETDK